MLRTGSADQDERTLEARHVILACPPPTNTLAGIRAMGEALEDGIAPDPASYHRAIVAEAERTAAMVDDVLALAGLQSGTLELNSETVTVSDLVSDPYLRA